MKDQHDKTYRLIIATWIVLTLLVGAIACAEYGRKTPGVYLPKIEKK